jgi:hypothetical protein
MKVSRAIARASLFVVTLLLSVQSIAAGTANPAISSDLKLASEIGLQKGDLPLVQWQGQPGNSLPTSAATLNVPEVNCIRSGSKSNALTSGDPFAIKGLRAVGITADVAGWKFTGISNLNSPPLTYSLTAMAVSKQQAQIDLATIKTAHSIACRQSSLNHQNGLLPGSLHFQQTVTGSTYPSPSGQGCEQYQVSTALSNAPSDVFSHFDQYYCIYGRAEVMLSTSYAGSKPTSMINSLLGKIMVRAKVLLSYLPLKK